MRSFKNIKISSKQLSILTSLIYFISLIPILGIACFNYPAADDFSMGLEVHQVYAATGSIFAAFFETIRMGIYYYLTWTGYYFADLFMSAPPNVYSEALYPITTWLLIGMLSFGTLYFFHALFVKALGADKHLTNAIGMIVLFVSIQCMVSKEARVEGFFWYSGAVNYTFLYGVGLTFCGLLISFVFNKSRGKRIADLVLACVFGFMTGGANYMTALSAGIISFLVIVGVLVSFFAKKEFGDSKASNLQFANRLASVFPDGFSRLVFIPCIIEMIGLLFACFAPGNSNREASLTGMNPIKAVLVSLYYTFDLAISDWSTWAVICLFLIMIPIMWILTAQILFKNKDMFSHPIIVIVFCYLLTSANITPPMYAMGNIGAGRMQAVFWLQYVFLMTVSLFEVVGFLRKKYAGVYSCSENCVMSKGPLRVMTFLCIVFLFGSFLCVKVDSSYYTMTSAARDLFNGSALIYNNECKERLAVLEDDSVSDVVFEDFSCKPELLYFSDITTDAEDWCNRAVARYYEKNSVVRSN